MRFKIKPMFLVYLIILAGIYSCYPDKLDSVTESDIAATVYDENFLPGEYTTFTVLDTVMHMTDDDEDDENLSREHDAYILGLIKQNMRDLGYTEIPEPDSLNKPELILYVSAFSSDYYGMYWWDYWGYYPGWDWWFPGYPGYPGYPWYPSYPWYPGIYYAYTTGTLMVEMHDVDQYDPDDQKFSMIWTGVVNGILVNNSQLTRDRLDKQINQLFIQSPYLEK